MGKVKWLLLFVLLLSITGCKLVVENADDVYLAETNNYLESFESLTSFTTNDNELEGKLKKNYESAIEIRNGFEKLHPPAKYQKEHKEMLEMFNELESFYSLFIERINKPDDPNIKLKHEQSMDRLKSLSDKYDKEPFRIKTK